MTSIRIHRLRKKFGDTTALHEVDLEIAAGELFFLLGPSGCGKSTLLRLIAGLLEPTSGQIFFNDRNVTPLSTEQRNAVMCFQSYALWPHMTVRQNIQFGLNVRNLSAAERDQRIADALKLVQLEPYAQRKPNALSGGQQQRAALARALAVRPDCLLLDEPLSNLDAKLRHEMRGEIRRICKSAGFTTIYVTHDQKEALSIADRIAVMNAGKIVQVGTPGELYYKPVTSFVADFLGQTNLLRGVVAGRVDNMIRITTPVGAILATANGASDGNVVLSIRPEQMRIVSASAPKAPNRLSGKVIETTFLGEATEHLLAIGEQRIKVVSTPPVFDPPPELPVEFDPKDVVVLPECSHFMRRYGYILAIVLMLIPPMLTRWMRGNVPADIPDASVPRLVIITPHNQDIRNEFRWAFADWHQKKYGQRVELEFLAVGGTNDITRQLDTTYREIRNRHGGTLPSEDQVDVGIQVVWGGGDFFFNQLKGLGILRPIDLDPSLIAAAFPQPTLGGLKLYDQDRDKSGKLLPPKWIGVCLSSFGIVYNPDLYAAMGLTPPVTWADLTDPHLAGSIALADPSHSSSAAVAYMMVIQRAMADAEAKFFDLPENKSIPHDQLAKTPGYSAALDAGWLDGMRRLLLIAANARYFSDSATQVPTDVSSGDAAAGVAIDFYGHVVSQIVGPQREKYVSPPAATAINPDPIAILYGTQDQKLELAWHFVEFLLTPQGQRLWILNVGQPDGPRQRALHRSPIRQDLYADRTGWADDANYFAEAGGFNQRGPWGANLTDVRMIWSATWIDDRDDLRDAYEKILAIPDPQRRQTLLNELLDIPITRGQVDEMMAHRRKVEGDSKQDADQWHARQRTDWARRFRDHYRKVADEASQ